MKNLKGRLTLVSNSVASRIYSSYDALGRTTASSQKFAADTTSYDFSYEYNFAALRSMHYPSGRQVSYTFDGAGRVTTVSGLSGGAARPYVTGVSYAPQGALQLISYGSGNYEQTCYNSRLQVQAMVLRATAPGDASVCTGATNPLWQLTLGYGSANNGNLMAQTIGDGASWSVAQNYSYDKLNRVLSAEEPSITGGQGWKRTYNYDRWGNQWVDATNSSGINVYSATPTGSAWITPKNRINLSAGSYDRAGNQISLPPYSAAYDADNRLTTMSSTLAYAYDGEGHRVTKVNGDLTTRYVYDALGQLAAEYAIGTPPSGAPQPECSTCYLTVDHLGSTRVLWDSAGVKGRYDYMPFGDAIPSDRNKRDSVSCAAGVTACYAGSGSLTMRFTGKERDAETSNSAMGDGLDYFGARYFSAAQGRFTSTDPVFVTKQRINDPQQWNLYVYGRNNPLRFIDPNGLDIITYDQSGNEIKDKRVKQSKWHNFWSGDSYKIKTEAGKTYNLSESLTPLKEGQRYQVVGPEKTSQMMSSFLASQSPTSAGQSLPYSEIINRATDSKQWNWKIELNREYGAHSLFVLGGTAQRSDYLGNFAFGYLMNAWGSSTIAAKWGGAAFNMYDSFRTGANAFKGSALTGYDDPRDFDAINAGGALYDQQH